MEVIVVPLLAQATSSDSNFAAIVVPSTKTGAFPFLQAKSEVGPATMM